MSEQPGQNHLPNGETFGWNTPSIPIGQAYLEKHPDCAILDLMTVETQEIRTESGYGR